MSVDRTSPLEKLVDHDWIRRCDRRNCDTITQGGFAELVKHRRIVHHETDAAARVPRLPWETS